MQEPKTEQTQTESKGEGASVGRQMTWVTLGMVATFIILLGIVQPGLLTGRSAGGNQPMGCGGSPPPETNKASNRPSPAKFGTSKQYLVSARSAIADTTIMQSNDGPYGTLNKIVLKNEDNGRGRNVRRGLVKFEVKAANAYRSIESTLEMVLVSHSVDQTFTVGVFGLKTMGEECSANDFNEATTLYRNIPVVDNSADGVADTHPCLFRPKGYASNALPVLATVKVSMNQVGKTITFKSPELTEYIQYQANQVSGDNVSIVLLLSRQESYNAVTSFASKERSSAEAPRLSLTYQAPNDTLTTNGDTYLQLDNAGPFGKGDVLVVKKDGSDRTNRHALIKFHVNNLETNNSPYATLMLDVAGHDWASAKYHVWGLKTGAGCQVNDFNEATVKHSDIGIGDRSGDGVSNSHPCLYTTSALGTFNVASSQVGETVTFASAKMNEYIQEQVSQSAGSTTAVAFMLTRDVSGGQPSYFASKEHASLKPPRLKLSNIVPGEQNVCNQTCTNCPQKAFSATCSLTDNYEQIAGQKMRQLKISTMGRTFSLYANWLNVSQEGRSEFQTGGLIALKTSKGNIPMSPLGGATVHVTCAPYLSIKGQLGSLPGIEGVNKLVLDNMVNTPSLSLGVRLGTHLKEDYKTTPFGDCRPYFFVAVDTETGAGSFKANKKLGLTNITFLLAFDPADPSFITEVGGDLVKTASGDTVKDIGYGASWGGMMQWTSAVPLPKSIKSFNTLEKITINGHLYGHIAFMLPIPLKPLVDANVFMDTSALGSLTKSLVNNVHSGIFKKDLTPIGDDKLKKMKVGFNVNETSLLIANLLKIKLGSGSYVRMGDTTRFAGYLKTPDLKAPQFIDQASTKVYNFTEKLFNKVSNAIQAKIDVRGVVEQDSLIVPKYRVKVTAEGKVMGLASASSAVALTLSNTDEEGKAMGLYGEIMTSTKFQDFTKNVVSSSFDVSGLVDFSGSRGIYTNLTGRTDLTVGDVKVVGVSVSISNKNVIEGKASLSGTLNMGIVNTTLTGTANGVSFGMSGKADINLTPVVNVVSLGAEELVTAAKTGYSCSEAYAQCGYKYVTKTVSNAKSCVTSIKCTKRELGFCIRWSCKVKDGYENCYKCRKRNSSSITLPSVKMNVGITLKDDATQPIAGAVSVVTGSVSGAIASFQDSKREVCYNYPQDFIKNKAKEFLGVSTNDIDSDVTKYCKKIF